MIVTVEFTVLEALSVAALCSDVVAMASTEISMGVNVEHNQEQIRRWKDLEERIRSACIEDDEDISGVSNDLIVTWFLRKRRDHDSNVCRFSFDAIEQELRKRIRESPYSKDRGGPFCYAYVNKLGDLMFDIVSPFDKLSGYFLPYRIGIYD